MKTTRLRHLVAALASGAVLAGCSSPPVLLPPDASLRVGLGRVAVVTLTDSPRIRYQCPDSRADVVAEAVAFETVTPCMILQHTGPGYGPADGLAIGTIAVATPLVVMGGAPLWQGLRRTYGLAIADSADAVAAARATLDAAAHSLRFDSELGARVAAELRRQSADVPVALTRRDADTVLELLLYEPNLSSRTGEGINPALGLSLGLRVRLLDARSGQELYYDYLDYRGPKHTLVNWAAQDGRAFHAEIERCLAQLSTEIVAQLFTRDSGQAADRGALAAAGIERRPPSPPAPGGSLWVPIVSRHTYARR